MHKNMERETETGVIWQFVGIGVSRKLGIPHSEGPRKGPSIFGDMY